MVIGCSSKILKSMIKKEEGEFQLSSPVPLGLIVTIIEQKLINLK